MSALNQVMHVIGSRHISNQLLKSNNDKFGGLLSNGQYAWFAFEDNIILYSKQLECIVSSRSFAYYQKNKSLKITCVKEINSKKVCDFILVGCSFKSSGLIFVCQMPTLTTVRCIEIPYPISYIAKIINEPIEENQLCDEFNIMSTVLLVGMATGAVYAVDLRQNYIENQLRRNEIVVNELKPNKLFIIRKNEDCQEVKEMSDNSDCHLAMFINENFHAYCKKQHDCKLNLNISSLLYIEEINSIAIGYSTGHFQLWDCKVMRTMYFLNEPKCVMPVTHIGFLEPSDDPNNLCYLWIIQSDNTRLPNATMVALTYEQRTLMPNGCLSYRIYQGDGVKLEMSLKRETGIGRCISALSLCNVNFFKDETDVDEDCEIRLFTMLLEVRQNVDADPETYIFLFDINQWYKAQMPSNITHLKVSNSYASFVKLPNKTSYLDFYISDQTLRPFNYNFRNNVEELYYPSSIYFECDCLTDTEIIRFKHPGVQQDILDQLLIKSWRLLTNPTLVFSHCIQTNLRPFFWDKTDDYENYSLPEQRSFLISILVENKIMSVLGACAEEWKNGTYASSEATILHLVQCLWKHIMAVKQYADKLCVPLFDYSGTMLDKKNERILNHCLSQMQCVKHFLEDLHDKFGNHIINVDYSYRVYTLNLVTQYFKAVTCFINYGLLPESIEDNSLQHIIQCNFNLLVEYANKRRSDLGNNQLYLIDAIINNEPKGHKLIEQWLHEGYESSKGMYPPSNVQCLLRIYLNVALSNKLKHFVTIYFLIDICSTQNLDVIVANRMCNFAVEFDVEDQVLNTVCRASWLLDHDMFEEAMDIFSIDKEWYQVEDWDWFHWTVLKLLVFKKKYYWARFYMKRINMKLVNIDDHKFYVNLQILNNQCFDALSYIRTLPLEEKYIIFEYFFDRCRETKILKNLLEISFESDEEELFCTYLKKFEDSEIYSLQLLFLLQRGRYLEASKLNKTLLYTNKTKDNEMLSIASSLVCGFDKTIPNILKQEFCGLTIKNVYKRSDVIVKNMHSESKIFNMMEKNRKSILKINTPVKYSDSINLIVPSKNCNWKRSPEHDIHHNEKRRKMNEEDTLLISPENVNDVTKPIGKHVLDILNTPLVEKSLASPSTSNHLSILKTGSAKSHRRIITIKDEDISETKPVLRFSLPASNETTCEQFSTDHEKSKNIPGDDDNLNESFYSVETNDSNSESHIDFIHKTTVDSEEPYTDNSKIKVFCPDPETDKDKFEHMDISMESSSNEKHCNSDVKKKNAVVLTLLSDEEDDELVEEPSLTELQSSATWSKLINENHKLELSSLDNKKVEPLLLHKNQENTPVQHTKTLQRVILKINQHTTPLNKSNQTFLSPVKRRNIKLANSPGVNKSFSRHTDSILLSDSDDCDQSSSSSSIQCLDDSSDLNESDLDVTKYGRFKSQRNRIEDSDEYEDVSEANYENNSDVSLNENEESDGIMSEHYSNESSENEENNLNCSNEKVTKDENDEDNCDIDVNESDSDIIEDVEESDCDIIDDDEESEIEIIEDGKESDIKINEDGEESDIKINEDGEESDISSHDENDYEDDNNSVLDNESEENSLDYNNVKNYENDSESFSIKEEKCLDYNIKNNENILKIDNVSEGHNLDHNVKCDEDLEFDNKNEESNLDHNNVKINKDNSEFNNIIEKNNLSHYVKSDESDLELNNVNEETNLDYNTIKNKEKDLDQCNEKKCNLEKNDIQLNNEKREDINVKTNKDLVIMCESSENEESDDVEIICTSVSKSDTLKNNTQCKNDLAIESCSPVNDCDTGVIKTNEDFLHKNDLNINSNLKNKEDIKDTENNSSFSNNESNMFDDQNETLNVNMQNNLFTNSDNCLKMSNNKVDQISEDGFNHLTMIGTESSHLESFDVDINQSTSFLLGESFFGKQEVTDNKPMLLFGQVYSFEKEPSVINFSENKSGTEKDNKDNISESTKESEEMEVDNDIHDILELESLPESNPDENSDLQKYSNISSLQQETQEKKEVLYDNNYSSDPLNPSKRSEHAYVEVNNDIPKSNTDILLKNQTLNNIKSSEKNFDTTQEMQLKESLCEIKNLPFIVDTVNSEKAVNTTDKKTEESYNITNDEKINKSSETSLKSFRRTRAFSEEKQLNKSIETKLKHAESISVYNFVDNPEYSADNDKISNTCISNKMISPTSSTLSESHSCTNKMENINTDLNNENIKLIEQDKSTQISQPTNTSYVNTFDDELTNETKNQSNNLDIMKDKLSKSIPNEEKNISTEFLIPNTNKSISVDQGSTVKQVIVNISNHSIEISDNSSKQRLTKENLQQSIKEKNEETNENPIVMLDKPLGSEILSESLDSINRIFHEMEQPLIENTDKLIAVEDVKKIQTSRRSSLRKSLIKTAAFSDNPSNEILSLKNHKINEVSDQPSTSYNYEQVNKNSIHEKKSVRKTKSTVTLPNAEIITRSRAKSESNLIQFETNSSNIFRTSEIAEDKNRQVRVSLSKKRSKSNENIVSTKRRSGRSKSLDPIGDSVVTRKTTFGLEQIPEEESSSLGINEEVKRPIITRKSKFNFSSNKTTKVESDVSLQQSSKVKTPKKSKSVQSSPALTLSVVKAKPKKSSSINVLISEDQNPDEKDGLMNILKKALVSPGRKRLVTESTKNRKKQKITKEIELDVNESKSNLNESDSDESSSYSFIEHFSPIAGNNSKHMIFTPTNKLKVTRNSECEDSSSDESTDSKHIITRSMIRNTSYVELEPVNPITKKAVKPKTSLTRKKKLSESGTSGVQDSSIKLSLSTEEMPDINKSLLIKRKEKNKETSVQTPIDLTLTPERRMTRSRKSILDRSLQSTSVIKDDDKSLNMSKPEKKINLTKSKKKKSNN